MGNLFDLATRVKRGALLLDKKFPGWRKVMRKHDADFDLTDGSHCVLGTLEHHMGRAKELVKKNLNKDNAFSDDGYNRLTAALRIPGSEFGFNTGPRDSDGDEYSDLSDLWRAEYREEK
jgi:hypothetical protein